MIHNTIYLVNDDHVLVHHMANFIVVMRILVVKLLCFLFFVFLGLLERKRFKISIIFTHLMKIVISFKSIILSCQNLSQMHGEH